VPKQESEVVNEFYASYGKRLLDLALAVPALIVFVPLFTVIALCVRLKIGSPVFFRQHRPGLYGKTFTLLKFRTMTQACDASGNLLPDAERLPDFGRFLRSTSLDELPELINVLRGEMSLVGPRPLLIRYLPRYTPEQARRHEVKPGVTGWAQINGRNAITWEEKFTFDAWYVENRSFGLDVKVIALTFWKIIKREGVSGAGQATMEEFWGVQKDSNLTSKATN
jgi:sugar transferase EpsL